jgi:hypothetical protein
MVQIRLEAKTFVITDEGEWIKVWDEREPITMTTDELDKAGGGITMIPD